MDRLTDEQLMVRLQEGQTSSLDELYRRYAKKLYAFCRYAIRSGDSQEAEDMVQDVFVRVIKAAHTFDPSRALFRTWVFRIARNHCIDVARRRGRFAFLPFGRKEERGEQVEETAPEDALADGSESVEGLVIRTATIQAVRDCIDAIDNENERQAILLYYLAGKVYREIGEILGESLSMARNRVKAAQGKVKRCLESKGVDSVGW